MVALITDRELTASEMDEVAEDVFAMAGRLAPDPEWEAYEAGIAAIGARFDGEAESMREFVNRR